MKCVDLKKLAGRQCRLDHEESSRRAGARAVKKRELLEGLRATQTPLDKRKTVYHEAGHAAFYWLFGYGSDIDLIDMRGTLDAKACVNDANGTSADSFRPPLHASFAALRTKWNIMASLAGYAAESRICPSKDSHWLDEQLISEGSDWYKDDPTDTHDVARDLRSAKQALGPQRRCVASICPNGLVD